MEEEQSRTEFENETKSRKLVTKSRKHLANKLMQKINNKIKNNKVSK